jgi:hypothetical protein
MHRTLKGRSGTAVTISNRRSKAGTPSAAMPAATKLWRQSGQRRLGSMRTEAYSLSAPASSNSAERSSFIGMSGS